MSTAVVTGTLRDSNLHEMSTKISLEKNKKIFLQKTVSSNLLAGMLCITRDIAIWIPALDRKESFKIVADDILKYFYSDRDNKAWHLMWVTFLQMIHVEC